MTDLKQDPKVRANVKINGYTSSEWLRKYGYSALNRCILAPVTPMGNEMIEVAYKIYGLKEWTDKENTRFWYCWHEWNPETQTLSSKPVTQEDIDKIALNP